MPKGCQTATHVRATSYCASEFCPRSGIQHGLGGDVADPCQAISRTYPTAAHTYLQNESGSSSSARADPFRQRLTGSRDLSNRKLAQNQAELSRQIADLKTTVEAQADMLRILVAKFAHESKEEEEEENDGRGWTR